jgi:hypothetical protein
MVCESVSDLGIPAFESPRLCTKTSRLYCPTSIPPLKKGDHESLLNQAPLRKGGLIKEFG